MFKKRKYLSFLLAVTMLVTLFAFPASAAQATPVAAVMGFSMGSNTINLGQTVIFTVETTQGANNVAVVYDGKTAQATQDQTTGANKRWTVSFAPAKSQTVQLIVSASADITGAATLQIPVSVNSTATTPTNPVTPSTPNRPAVSTPASSVTIDNITETSAGKTVTLTVTTNAAANNVWVSYENATKYTQATPASNDGGVKTWTLKFNPSAIQMVTVSANTSYKTNGAANKDYTLEFTSSLKPPATASITSATTNRTSVYENENIDITVRTNLDTQYVWVEYEGTSVDASMQSETRSSKTWRARISPSETGSARAVVYANTFDGAEGAASRNVNYSVRDRYSYNYDYGYGYGYNSGYGQVLNAVAGISWASAGYGTFTFEIVTSPYVNYVRFSTNGGSSYNYNMPSPTLNANGDRVWRYTTSSNADVRAFNVQTLYVQASEDSGFYSGNTSAFTVNNPNYNAGYGSTASGGVSEFGPTIGQTVSENSNITFYVTTDANTTSVVITPPVGYGFTPQTFTSPNQTVGAYDYWTCTIMGQARPGLYTATAYVNTVATASKTYTIAYQTY